jgi:hypothetical protein
VKKPPFKPPVKKFPYAQHQKGKPAGARFTG